MACPEAEDDRRYGFGLAAACMSWAIIRLQRFVLLDTRAPGDDSRPQLVEPLEAAACTATAHRAFPLTSWALRTADLLRRSDAVRSAGAEPSGSCLLGYCHREFMTEAVRTLSGLLPSPAKAIARGLGASFDRLYFFLQRSMDGLGFTEE